MPSRPSSSSEKISNQPHKVTCTLNKADFLKALAHQNSLLEKRSPSPILSHVLLSPQKGGSTVTLYGTGSGISLIQSLPAKIEGAQEFTFPGHLVYELTKQLASEEEVILCHHWEEGKTHGYITLESSQGASYQFPSFPPEEFPKFTGKSLPYSLTLPSQELLQALLNTRFAMSLEEAQYYLNGLYIHPQGSNLHFVATDAHRLALYSLPLDQVKESSGDISQEFQGMILGRKAVFDLCRILEDTPGDITLSFSESYFQASGGGTRFYSPLAVGNYPDYSSTLLEKYTFEVILEVSDFAKALNRLDMVAHDKSKVVRMELTWKNSTLSLEAHSQESGFGREILPFQCATPPADTLTTCMGFNPRYLISVCQHIQGDKIHMHVMEPTMPALFTDPHHPRASFVIMPTRTAQKIQTSAAS